MPTDGCGTGREPILERITESVSIAGQALLPEFKRKKPPRGIVYIDNANTGITNPFEP